MFPRINRPLEYANGNKKGEKAARARWQNNDHRKASRERKRERRRDTRRNKRVNEATSRGQRVYAEAESLLGMCTCIYVYVCLCALCKGERMRRERGRTIEKEMKKKQRLWKSACSADLFIFPSRSFLLTVHYTGLASTRIGSRYRSPFSLYDSQIDSFSLSLSLFPRTSSLHPFPFPFSAVRARDRPTHVYTLAQKSWDTRKFIRNKWLERYAYCLFMRVWFV